MKERSHRTLTEIALSKCDNLENIERLSLCNSTLDDFTYLEDLKHLVGQMPKLKYLDLSGNHFATTDFLNWLCNWLREDPERKVNISDMVLTEKLYSRAIENGISPDRLISSEKPGKDVCVGCKKLRDPIKLKECVNCSNSGPWCQKCPECSECGEENPGDWTCGGFYRGTPHEIQKGLPKQNV